MSWEKFLDAQATLNELHPPPTFISHFMTFEPVRHTLTDLTDEKFNIDG